MANRVVAEHNIIAVRNHSLIALSHGEGHEVVGFPSERGRHRHRHCRNHAVEIVVGNGDLARAGVADAVRSL